MGWTRDHDGLTRISAGELDALRAALAGEGYRIWTLDGAEVIDKAGFLARAERDLPRPEGLSPHNLDAFADCLWAALSVMEETKVAFIWERADRLQDHDPKSMNVAQTILAELIEDALEPDEGFPASMDLRVVLVSG